MTQANGVTNPMKEFRLAARRRGYYGRLLRQFPRRRQEI